MKNRVYLLIVFSITLLTNCQFQGTDNSADLFDKDNLIAWCIVPFDAADRSPVERAQMLNELGISQLA